jgi:hypothetical protein
MPWLVVFTLAGVAPVWSQASVKAAGDVETDAQLKSNVAEGTAPLVVSSSTMVQNLNADQVDGFEGSDLADLLMAVQDQVEGRYSCRTASGALGTVLDGVCLLDYDNTGVNWAAAVSSCVQTGGDLCSVSQYYTLRTNDPDLFYSGKAVWSCNFSDNDGGAKTTFIASSDNPTASQLYGFGCCGRSTPEPYRSELQVVNGVAITLVHDREDTTFRAAARICHARGSDLCSKSQYTALDGLFSSTATRRATREMSDNDGELFADVVGSNAGDNPQWTQLWAYACCGSTRPLDGSCPGTEAPNGVCYGSIRDVEDASFFDAAAACQLDGADICSNSQMEALRSEGLFSVSSWTSDGADNDGNIVGGLLAIQLDNPTPGTLYGYACCY